MPRVRMLSARRQAYQCGNARGSRARPTVFTKTGVSGATRSGWMAASNRTVSGRSSTRRREDAVFVAESSAIDHGPDPLVVLAQQPRPLRIADALEHRGRVADVGEHHRREHPRADVLGRLSVRMSARELDRLPRDVALHPCHVSRWDLVCVAGPDGEGGAVVRAHGEPAGNGVADVAMLTRVRAGDRADVRRPPPSGLEDEAAHVDLVERDDLDEAVRKASDLVGLAEALALQS